MHSSIELYRLRIPLPNSIYGPDTLFLDLYHPFISWIHRKKYSKFAYAHEWTSMNVIFTEYNAYLMKCIWEKEKGTRKPKKPKKFQINNHNPSLTILGHGARCRSKWEICFCKNKLNGSCNYMEGKWAFPKWKSRDRVGDLNSAEANFREVLLNISGLLKEHWAIK